MRTALVTGACGFIARHLAPALFGRTDIQLHGVDRRAHRIAGYADWSVVDLEDARDTRALVERVQADLVFHLVGQFRGTDEEIERTNVGTTRHLLDAVRRATPSARVVVIGSAAEYGHVDRSSQPVVEEFEKHPVSAYGRAKQQVAALAREYATVHALRVMLARPFNPVGPGIADTLVVGAIIRRLRAVHGGGVPAKIRIGSTTAVRDFVDVRDVAEGILRVAERGRAGEAYNLCSGTGHTIAEVLDELLGLAGLPGAFEPDQALLRMGEVDELVGSAEKAGRELGWRALTPLEDSVRAAWDASVPAGAAS